MAIDGLAPGEYCTLVAEWREVSILHIGTGIEWKSSSASRGPDGGSEESIKGSDDERGGKEWWIRNCCFVGIRQLLAAVSECASIPTALDLRNRGR